MNRMRSTRKNPTSLCRPAWSRRQFVLAASGGFLSLYAGCGGSSEDGALATPESCAETPGDIEGPFWRPDSPERTNLDLYADAGTSLSISGRVLGVDCRPIEEAVVEVWHGYPTTVGVADLSPSADVEYDNASDEMRYRGLTVVDEDGYFSFRTLKPGWYKALGVYRPAHVHFKVWKDGVELLTTQMYFAGDPFLASDPWAVGELAVALDSDSDGAERAVFDLVVPSSSLAL